MDVGSTTRTGLLGSLRARTAAEHDRLERGLNLLDGSLSPARYQVLLERFYGYYVPVEARLIDHPLWGAFGLEMSGRRKSGWLVQDLLCTGRHDRKSISELPHCDVFPDLTSFPHLVGCAYVLEGATLGGQVIVRHLWKRFEGSTMMSHRFFSSYGGEVAARWREFREFVERFTERSDGHAEEAAVHAARETFQTLHAWLVPDRNGR